MRSTSVASPIEEKGADSNNVMAKEIGMKPLELQIDIKKKLQRLNISVRTARLKLLFC
jgi:hypothetical protein